MRLLTEEPPVLEEIRATLGAPPRGFTRLFSGSLQQLLHPPANQLPFLHGLRAFAVLLVMNHHFDTYFTTAHGTNAYSALPFVANGWSGVDLFFVLSGFFIGGQLWKELWKDGSISIRRFVLRRGLRIWPLYFFTFVCVFALMPGYAVLHHFGWADLVFLSNYLQDGVHYTDGIILGGWSLCVEEQFYLLAPVLLYVFARGRSPASSLRWLWAIFLALPLLRAGIWFHHTGSFAVHDSALFQKIFYSQFHTHCDGLVLGMILSHQWVSRNRPKISRPRAIALIGGGLLLFVVLRHVQHEVLIFSALALLFGSLVWAGLVGRLMLFRGRLFYWLSRLSFGMYLNHHYLRGLVVDTLLPRLHGFPQNSIANELIGFLLFTLLSTALALVTFCLVEHPFLSLRMQLLEPDAEHAHARR